MRWQYCVQVRLLFMATNKLVVLQLALAVFCPNEEKDLGSIGQHDVLKRENGENVGLL